MSLGILTAWHIIVSTVKKPTFFWRALIGSLCRFEQFESNDVIIYGVSCLKRLTLNASMTLSQVWQCFCHTCKGFQYSKSQTVIFTSRLNSQIKWVKLCKWFSTICNSESKKSREEFLILSNFPPVSFLLSNCHLYKLVQTGTF